jgi:multiple sugar transport system ATP-binding protein
LEVGDRRLIVVMHGRTPVQPDDVVRLRVDPARVHVFDGAGGVRL